MTDVYVPIQTGKHEQQVHILLYMYGIMSFLFSFKIFKNLCYATKDY